MGVDRGEPDPAYWEAQRNRRELLQAREKVIAWLAANTARKVVPISQAIRSAGVRMNHRSLCTEIAADPRVECYANDSTKPGAGSLVKISMDYCTDAFAVRQLQQKAAKMARMMVGA
jgi:hypothetical protein